MRALWSAASGMLAQQLNVDIIANNLANVNTAGFKKSKAEFQELMYETMSPPAASGGTGGLEVPAGIQVGHGVRVAATQKLFTPGSFQATGNQLDLAIEGEGFFEVSLPGGGRAYTRDGSFKLDGEGRIITTDGYRVTLEGFERIPSGTVEVSVSPDGTVAVILEGDSGPTALGRIPVTRFPNPAGLLSMGKNLFRPSAASGLASQGTAGQGGLGTIIQGYLEMSNVQVVEEMVNLIIAQRAYEMNSKAIQASDEMLSMASNLRR